MTQNQSKESTMNNLREYTDEELKEMVERVMPLTYHKFIEKKINKLVKVLESEGAEC